MPRRTPESATLQVDPSRRRRTARWTSLTLIAFSLFYFAETLLRASEKWLWYDELCTYYICRLPSFKDSWAAVMHGADFNPPLFYLIYRTFMRVFGDGRIGMRLAPILGFWILCLCLFWIVNRRVGLSGGLVAMVLPLLTGAYAYAYEARAYGLLLGFFGLAILFWQKWEDQPKESRWLIGLALSLQAAFLIHCYAIVAVTPFVLVELYRSKRNRQIEWRVWVAILLPLAIACVSFIPLLRAYAPLKTYGFNAYFPSTISRIPVFFEILLGYSLLLAIAAIGLFAFDAVFDHGSADPVIEQPRLNNARADIILALAFLGMPFYGLIVAKVVKGPYVFRYFETAVIGFCLALAFGAGFRMRKRAAAIFTALVIAMAAFLFVLLIDHRVKGVGEELYEPSIKSFLSTDPHDPLKFYPLLHSSAYQSLPIAVPSIIQFLYLVHYWPEGIPHLYPVEVSSTSASYLLTRNVREGARVSYNPEVTFDRFVEQHPDFLVYTDSDDTAGIIAYLITHGAEIRSCTRDPYGNTMSQFHMPAQHH